MLLRLNSLHQCFLLIETLHIFNQLLRSITFVLLCALCHKSPVNTFQLFDKLGCSYTCWLPLIKVMGFIYMQHI